jgi:hypothetical protein
VAPKYPITHSFKLNQTEIDWLKRDGERLGTQMHLDLQLLKTLYETMRVDPFSLEFYSIII